MPRAKTKSRTLGILQTRAAADPNRGAACMRECVRAAVVAVALFSPLAAVPAMPHEQNAVPEATRSALKGDTLPSLDLIDAQTDIKVFLQSSVPEELRLAALRRAWTADPAIRDFVGLQEMNWDFGDPNSILGFGRLGPEVGIEEMVAQIFGETPQLVASLPERRRSLFFRLALRLFDLRSTAAASP